MREFIIWKEEREHESGTKAIIKRPALPEVTDHTAAPAEHMTSLCMCGGEGVHLTVKLLSWLLQHILMREC